MSISQFYKKFTLLNDIFYQNSAIDVLSFLESELMNIKTLDVGCGDGQLTLPLLKKGFNIYGFDISEDMLKVLQSNVENKNNFIVKDALEFSEDDLGKFSQAYCMRTSFGNFEHDSLNIKYLENIYNSLNDDGIFYLDYLNFNKLLDNFNNVIIMEKDDYILKRQSEIINNYMHQKWTLYQSGNELFNINLGTYIYLEEAFNTMLTNIGFTIEKTFGNYNKELFDLKQSDRLIYKLKK
jgi:SAM-dependent methyltransferase